MSSVRLNDPTRIRDNKIVEGYIRKKYLSKSSNIPKDIIDLLYLFYHIVIPETFKHYNSSKYRLESDDMILTRIGTRNRGSDSVVYGSQCISSMNEEIHRWTFKIIKKTLWWYIVFGIDETKHTRKEYGGFDTRSKKSKSYALWSNAYKCEHGDMYDFKKADNAPRFDTNDTVNMILDLSSKSVSYQVNHGDMFLAFEDIAVGQDIEYCMGVCIGGADDCVELLSYIIS